MFMMKSISLLHRSPASSKLEAKRDTVLVYPWSPSLPVRFSSRLLVLQAYGSAEGSTGNSTQYSVMIYMEKDSNTFIYNDKR